MADVAGGVGDGGGDGEISQAAQWRPAWRRRRSIMVAIKPARAAATPAEPSLIGAETLQEPSDLASPSAWLTAGSVLASCTHTPKLG